MPKTGWKYTKQMPAKGSTNMLKRSTASSKIGRKMAGVKSTNPNLRSNATIARLKMYETGKAVRNKEGKIVGGQFMMKDRAGDREITASTGRIAPDRRWFGNTRVVDPKALDEFRKAMTQTTSDPYSVVLKRKKLPMGLLQDAATMATANTNDALLSNEPFEHTFGSKSRRKRVKLEQLLTTRAQEHAAKQLEKQLKKDVQTGKAKPVEGKAEPVKAIENDADGYGALLKAAQQSHDHYDEVNTAEGILPWGRDANIERTEGEGVDWIFAKKDDLFLKGQSRRIWGELWKVVDCSDVILHVMDARNVEGTRCRMLEQHIAKNAPHKHLVYIINKIDLVPNWAAKRWVGHLAQHRPTIAFHASSNHAFGKGALISLLRQFSQLNSAAKQISVGIVGYPNVGKSSLINTLVGKRSCKVAPVPGETKVWQYVTLMKRIYLIDCPGVVVDTAGDTEVDSVLKGVVRSERLENPEDFIQPILEKVKPEHIAAQYGMPKDGWSSDLDLMEKLALKSGRLRKGGEPCLRSSAITIINDFQRGKLPHFVPPPELKDEDTDVIKKLIARNFTQNMDELGKKEPSDQLISSPHVESNDDSNKIVAADNDEDDAHEDDEDEDDDLPPVVVANAGEWDDED